MGFFGRYALLVPPLPIHCQSKFRFNIFCLFLISYFLSFLITPGTASDTFQGDVCAITPFPSFDRNQGFTWLQCRIDYRDKPTRAKPVRTQPTASKPPLPGTKDKQMMCLISCPPTRHCSQLPQVFIPPKFWSNRWSDQ